MARSSMATMRLEISVPFQRLGSKTRFQHKNFDEKANRFRESGAENSKRIAPPGAKWSASFSMSMVLRATASRCALEAKSMTSGAAPKYGTSEWSCPCTSKDAGLLG